jgi:HAE1 family hydrophobic/amphiphilic exporter-1
VVISGQRAPREITEIADKRIKRQLETVKDVGAITIVGGQKREIQVFVDPDRLSGYGLSIQQVKDALARQNVEIPDTGGAQEEGLRTLGRIETPEGFEELIVADLKGGPVRIRDIATVVDGEEEPRTLSRLNGRNAVSLVIRKQSGTNTVAVVDRIKARLAEIQKGCPGHQFEVVRDLALHRAHTRCRTICCWAASASLIVAVFIGPGVVGDGRGLIVGTVGRLPTGDPGLLLR